MGKADPLNELGRRLAARRKEAHVDVDTLARHAGVPKKSVAAFERGAGGLTTSALVRLALHLGVPSNSFLHTDAPEVPAPIEPEILLKQVGMASPISNEDRAALRRYIIRARSFTALGEILGSETVCNKFEPRPAKQRNAHLAGYDLARKVRKALGLSGGPLRDLMTTIEERFNILIAFHTFTDPRVRGGACRVGSARLIVVNTIIKHEASRRAILAHELAHHLADLDEEDARTDIERRDDNAASGFELDVPPEEKRANAFATMLLAPQETLVAMLGSPKQQFTIPSARAVVSRYRAVFGIGFEAMAWHLYHLGFFNATDDEMVKFVRIGDEVQIPSFEAIPGPEDGVDRRVAEALRRDAISEERARELSTPSLQ